MNSKVNISFILFCCYLFQFFVQSNQRICNIEDLVNEQCSKNETCANYNGSHYCDCLPGFIRNNITHCILDRQNPNTHTTKPSKFTDDVKDTTGNSHLVANILIPTVLIVIIVICSVFLIRKYKLVNYISNKIASQRTITYDEVIIGRDFEDDDPPLT